MFINHNFTSLTGFTSGSVKKHMSFRADENGFRARFIKSGSLFIGAEFTAGQQGSGSVFSAQHRFMSVTSVEITRISTTFSAFFGRIGQGVSVFEKTAVSSDPDVLSIKSFNQQPFEDMSVLVHQIASAQQNTGRMLNVNANPGTQKDGLYRFEIEIGGERHELSFTVDHRETNKTFQQKMAEAINSANIGVTASVALDADERNSALVLEGGENAQGFAIRDIEGNAVELMGAGTATREAQYAVFSVNGGEKQTSASNDVELINGVTVTLRQASDEPVNVTFEKNAEAARDGVFSMVTSINKMMTVSKQVWGTWEKDSSTGVFHASMERIIKTSVSALWTIGISMSRDGNLQIDPVKADEAAKNGGIERFFRGNGAIGRDFLSRMEKLFSNFNKNPWQFVSPDFRLRMFSSPWGQAAFNGFGDFDSVSGALDVKS